MAKPGDVMCGPPSGLKEAGLARRRCRRAASCYLVFMADRTNGEGAGGGWYLCDQCTLLVAFWLEDLWDSVKLEKQAV